MAGSAASRSCNCLAFREALGIELDQVIGKTRRVRHLDDMLRGLQDEGIKSGFRPGSGDAGRATDADGDRQALRRTHDLAADHGLMSQP